jgi:hypothetical protein
MTATASKLAQLVYSRLRYGTASVDAGQQASEAVFDKLVAAAKAEQRRQAGRQRKREARQRAREAAAVSPTS